MPRIPVALLLAALAATGCHGSTEPATEVRETDAKLNARGTADDGPAYSFFELWRTAEPAATRQTGSLSWPAGASGPFSQRVRDLAFGTSYSFRVCGNDQGEPAVCAQTRTFTTPIPPGDFAEGYFGSSRRPTRDFRARASSASGTAASGEYGYTVETPPTPPSNVPGMRRISFDVTCLEVEGDRAALTAVGQVDADPELESELLRIVRSPNQPEGPHSARFTRQEGGTPPSCANASFDGLDSYGYSGVVLNDAP